MTEDDVRQYVEAYINVSYKKDLLVSEKQKVINSILTPEQKAELDAIDFEFEAKFKEVEEEEKARRKMLDAAVDNYASTLHIGNEKIKIVGKIGTVTFTKGDIEWDAKSLDGYVLNHPEILSFRKENPPKVRITKNKV